jgi:hypothetical protein
MILEATAITGAEKITEPGSPYAALITFYKAFNTRNLALMTENWNTNNNSSMSNPLGGIKRGWPEIEAVYKKIFNGPAEVYVEYYDYTLHHTDTMFCVVGKERGHFIHREIKIDLAVRTTRIYQFYNNRWLQFHHHGSIDNPELLLSYQTAVLGNPQR